MSTKVKTLKWFPTRENNFSQELRKYYFANTFLAYILKKITLNYCLPRKVDTDQFVVFLVFSECLSATSLSSPCSLNLANLFAGGSLNKFVQEIARPRVQLVINGYE